MIIRPLHDFVVLRPLDADAMKGGIIIPDAYRRQRAEGVVIAFGPKVEHLAEGERVVFATQAPADHITTPEGVALIVLRYEFVLAVLPPVAMSGPVLVESQPQAEA